ncbi:AbrB/MazE/SpoVT family DNA-binding domain-containing protein [Methanocella conradii]|uniref:AbrB/MazE/SpoVT family DNA-binding domain-containing protein n=1 Tax=Methanocella conradii TaxID=1175444 RepID=UPI0024B34055|nr:AbrB/MazE/SpoVT family DNA-binding domain-containing protein [Methanocella conradii]MDI6897507.1 AbrB/MazE/SpoVT family DNA-binding domain-containing protein [Methanocella conradii]
MSMTKCPICDAPLVWEDKEIKKGIYARVQVCKKCQEHYIDLKEHERVYREYYSKAFKSGNSIAVIIPKKVADEAGIRVGTSFKINVKDGKIIIEAVA